MTQEKESVGYNDNKYFDTYKFPPPKKKLRSTDNFSHKPNHFSRDNISNTKSHKFTMYRNPNSFQSISSLPVFKADWDENRDIRNNTITNNIPDAQWCMDIDFNLTFISASIKELSGYTPEEFLALQYEDIFPTKFKRKFQATKKIFSRKINRDQDIPTRFWEFDLIHKDGRVVSVETVVSPQRKQNGNIEGLVGSLRDVTHRVQTRLELEQAKKEALQASQAKSDYLVNMSHEIRTPINGVLGMLQILKCTNLDSKQMEYVENAISAGTNLLNLISDVLDLSKIEAGKLESEESNIDLKTFMNSVVVNCESLLTTSDISLKYHIEQDAPKYVKADEMRLKQILLNLVGNSIKFTRHGEITINVSHRLNKAQSVQLYFTITDTGIGMPPDVMKHLFEPFVQVKKSFIPKYRGSGLGLHIVRQLVKVMGGDIQIKSKQNIGTTVTFNVSVQQLSAKHLLKQPQSSRAYEETPPMRLLVVEDDYTSALVASTMLQKLGHSVTLVNNGRQAIQRVEQESYDCIFMDIQIPEMDGLETSKAIRSSKTHKCPHTPIVALTAHAMKGDRERVLKAGMNDYITKPITISTLQNILHKVASNGSWEQ